jgi:hypothetical protein
MLRDHLRARRELIQPEPVGLPVHGVRRVAGLRREEVAMLAGILTRRPPTTCPAWPRHRRRPRRETVPASIRQLLGVLGLPA